MLRTGVLTSLRLPFAFCGMMIAIITPTFQEELSDFKWNYNSVKSVVQDATPKRSF